MQVIEDAYVGGKRKRVILESLGILGKDLSLTQAKQLIKDRYDGVNSVVSSKITLRELCETFHPLYKQKLTQEMFFKAALVHKAATVQELEGMIEAKTYHLSTYASYMNSMRHIVTCLGSVEISKIDIDDTQLFLNYLLRDKGLSANSIRIHFVELRKTLKYAVEKRWLKVLPHMPGINEINKLNVLGNNIVKEADTYSDEELAKMYSLANEDQRFLMELFMQTGMRPEEIDKMGLRESLVLVDFKNNAIMINSYRANKKGRLIPLSSKLKVSILERMKSGKITNRICPYPNTRLARRALQRLTLRANIKSADRKCNLKMFRATKNTHMIKNNIEGSMRASLLGNSMEVQVRHYTGNVMESLRTIVETGGALD